MSQWPFGYLDLLACCLAMSRKTVAEREKEELAASILAYFAKIRDPRLKRTRNVRPRYAGMCAHVKSESLPDLGL